MEETDLFKRIIETLIDKKGLNILFINLEGVVDYTDALILATGTSRPHIQALAGVVRQQVKSSTGQIPLNIEGFESGKWVLLDFQDIVLHVFDETTREYYDLEEIWADCPRIEFYLDNTGQPVRRERP